MNPRDTRVEEKTVAEVLEAFGRAPIAGWLRAQRWFGAKGRSLDSLATNDALVLDEGPPALALAVLDVRAGRPEVEQYVVPVSIDLRGGEIPGAIAHVEVGRSIAIVCDATDVPTLARHLLTSMLTPVPLRSTSGTSWSVNASDALRAIGPVDALLALDPLRIGGEQSNTSYRFGDRLLLKLLRRIQPGVHPEAEILTYLTSKRFAHAPRMLATLSIANEPAPTTVAMLQQFVPNRGDGWRTTLEDLRRTFHGGRDPTGPAHPLQRLGEITGELHATLASSRGQADLEPVPMRSDDGVALAGLLSERFDHISRAYRERHGEWLPTTRESVRALLEELGPALATWTPHAANVVAWGERIRVHGDFHLGQVLRTDDGYVIIDFEGEPARSLAARRERAHALRDVAGMLRSFDYARHVLVRELGAQSKRPLEDWHQAARAAFMAGYEPAVGRSPVSLLPRSAPERVRALAVFELEKALYEVLYEIDHRPDWIAIAADGARGAAHRLRRIHSEPDRG